MSVVTTTRSMINCDAWPCRLFFQGSNGCGYVAEARIEARVAGWRVNVPQEHGPRTVNPLPFQSARLDFCPQHRESVR